MVAGFDGFAPWSDGTYQIVLSPLELIEKLAALVPPPRLNLVRYHGVLAPHAAVRAQIVPGGQEPDAAESSAQGMAPLGPSCGRRSWAQLLRRVFQIDISVCPACGGHMKIIAALTDSDSIRTYLEGVDLPARPPPVAPARPDPQHEFEYAA